VLSRLYDVGFDWIERFSEEASWEVASGEVTYLWHVEDLTRDWPRAGVLVQIRGWFSILVRV
jgi:hypothetical protein